MTPMTCQYGVTVSTDLSDLTESLRRVLAQREDVLASYLFGSAANDALSAGSDVDIAVLMSARLTVADELQLRGILQSVVSPRRLDLVVLSDAPPTLAHRILKGGIVLTGEDAPQRIRHRVETLRNYMDLAHLRATLRAGTRHRLEEGRFGRP